MLPRKNPLVGQLRHIWCDKAAPTLLTSWSSVSPECIAGRPFLQKSCHHQLMSRKLRRGTVKDVAGHLLQASPSHFTVLG